MGGPARHLVRADRELIHPQLAATRYRLKQTEPNSWGNRSDTDICDIKASEISAIVIPCYLWGNLFLA